MESILSLKKSNCKNCYKCIRECGIKSIRFDNNQAHIISDECILCGMCFVTCPQNAKQIREDIDIAKELISTNEKVIVSLAPSFIAQYNTSIENITKALKKLGFYDVEETAIGAYLVKKEYENQINDENHKVIISSCCPSVNLLLKKHYPIAINSLSQTLSPMLAHGKYLKEKDSACKVVFIGPCVSKKYEGDNSEYIDCVLTFDELNNWLEAENIDLKKSNEYGDEKLSSRSFPFTGGIIDCMKKNPNYTYITVDGVSECIKVLNDYENYKDENIFIEMSACKGSCIGGPCMDTGNQSPIASYKKVVNFAHSGSKTNDFSSNIDLSHELKFSNIFHVKPGENAIKETLIKMGKTKPEDELNCSACGYNTCREKAIAVLEGKADISMCLPYMKEKAESFSDKIISNTPNAIIVMNEELKIQQINNAACNLFNIKDTASIIGSPVVNILNPTEYIKIMDNDSYTVIKDKKCYLAEYDKYIEESIIYDKDYRIVISFMKDITLREKNKNIRHEIKVETAEIADKVIEKQMRVVQEIASLLGETTAETKIALTKLKETLIK